MERELLYEVRGPKNITEMTAAELEERLKETDMIVFSFGAIENHGKHLPLGCDSFQGNVLVRRVAEKLAEKGLPAVPGFAMPFGVQTNQFERCENFGNCYVSQKTLIAMTEELVLSLTKSGFKKFVFCVSHAENLASMHVAAKDLADNHGVTCIVCNWIPPMNDEWPKFLKNPEHQGHGGEDETSCTMVAVPKLVNLDNLPGWYPPEAAEHYKLDGLEYYGGAVGIYAPLGSAQCPGYVGNPADATAEAGEKCYDLYAEWIASVVKKYLG
ncbi:MAG TPA: creatininase family protein [Candidatus Fimivivens faecavium]|nr:creatininase family protein [Candidatus Fimivivens faecavium]